jgi:hypothetical protein
LCLGELDGAPVDAREHAVDGHDRRSQFVGGEGDEAGAGVVELSQLLLDERLLKQRRCQRATVSSTSTSVGSSANGAPARSPLRRPLLTMNVRRGSIHAGFRVAVPG